MQIQCLLHPNVSWYTHHWRYNLFCGVSVFLLLCAFKFPFLKYCFPMHLSLEDCVSGSHEQPTQNFVCLIHVFLPKCRHSNLNKRTCDNIALALHSPTSCIKTWTGTLPCFSTLNHYSPHLYPDPSCPRCGSPRETIIHALFECPEIHTNKSALLDTLSSIFGGTRHIFQFPGIDFDLNPLDKTVSRAFLTGAIRMDFKERMSDFFGKVTALSKAKKVASAVRLNGINLPTQL